MGKSKKKDNEIDIQALSNELRRILIKQLSYQDNQGYIKDDIFDNNTFVITVYLTKGPELKFVYHYDINGDGKVVREYICMKANQKNYSVIPSFTSYQFYHVVASMIQFAEKFLMIQNENCGDNFEYAKEVTLEQLFDMHKDGKLSQRLVGTAAFSSFICTTTNYTIAMMAENSYNVVIYGLDRDLIDGQYTTKYTIFKDFYKMLKEIYEPEEIKAATNLPFVKEAAEQK